MNREQIQAYVDFTNKIATKSTAIKIFTFAFIFAILDIIISYIIQSNLTLIISILVSVVAIFMLIYAIVIKKRFIMILCMGLLYTYLSIIFAVFSYLILMSTYNVSILYLIFELLFYIVSSIVNIIIVTKLISKNKYFNKPNTALSSMGIGVLGGALGVIIAKIFVANLEYNSIILFTSILSFVVGIFFSIGSHFYFCYYLSKKYK